MGKKSRIFLKKKSAIGIIQFGLSNFFLKFYLVQLHKLFQSLGLHHHDF